MTHSEFDHHLSNGLSGLFSLGGQPDHLLVEYCVQFDPIFDQVSYRGVPDVRIIVFLGYPVMAMIRLPTRMSDGKANLHQGAIGVGIDIPTGLTRRGVWGTEIIREHPDTEHSIVGLSIPHWDELLLMSSRCYELSQLGYVGVDFVLDRNLGPLILELNARPGLAIQIANGNGLGHRLARVEALAAAGGLSPDPAVRVAFARRNFPTLG
jgi:alpha-L-glutamate ligase-like protein